jgi:hypothetical protein
LGIGAFFKAVTFKPKGSDLWENKFLIPGIGNVPAHVTRIKEII